MKVNSYQLPVWEDWPYPKPLDEDRYLLKLYISEYCRFLASMGWLERAYIYVVDEPNDIEAYERIRSWGTLLKEVEEEYGFHVDLLVTEQPIPDNPAWRTLVGSVDI